MRTLALALTGWAVLSAQPLSYTLLSAEGEKPAPRIDGTIAYDPVGRRVILFGGSADTDRNDLWAYSLAGRRWTELRPEGELPPPRFGHTLVLDSRRQRLILFGGQAGGFFNDTWSYDLDRNRWTRIAVNGTAPSRRYGHSAVYDAAGDRMIVSHGFTNAGRFDDTWALDLASGTWRDISPPSGRPLRRCLHHAVYDAAGGQMLLYGGCASGFGPCPLGDLWSFDLGSQRWTEITAAGKPAAREHYGLSFDSVRNRMIVFGGSGSSLLGDTWEFDPRARTWREAVINGPAPSPRSRHQGVFAEGRGVSFFFGGSAAAMSTNELWMLGPGFVLPSRPELSRDGVSNAFSMIADGVIAPGELLALRGSSLAAEGEAPSVTFNGIPAALLFASPAQLNVRAPLELHGAAEAVIRITAAAQPGDPVTVLVAPTHPGLFPGAFHPDGTAVTPALPAAPGQRITLYATGLGVPSPPARTEAPPEEGEAGVPVEPVTLTIGGIRSDVVSLGPAPGLAGVWRVEARLPIGTGGSAPVLLQAGAAASQGGFTIAVEEGHRP